METQALRLLIRQKLADGRLPRSGIPRAWGSRGDGQQCCACEAFVSKFEFVMEGLLPGDGLAPRAVQLHVLCCYLWDDERRRLADSLPIAPEQVSQATTYEAHTIVTASTQKGADGWAVTVTIRDVDGALAMASCDLGGGVTFDTKAIADDAGVLFARTWIDRRKQNLTRSVDER